MGTFQKIAVSLLSFISLAVFLMIVSIKAFTGSLEKLMLPALLGIIIYLLTRERAMFKELQQLLDVTPGNLDSHLRARG